MFFGRKCFSEREMFFCFLFFWREFLFWWVLFLGWKGFGGRKGEGRGGLGREGRRAGRGLFFFFWEGRGGLGEGEGVKGFWREGLLVLFFSFLSAFFRAHHDFWSHLMSGPSFFIPSPGISLPSPGLRSPLLRQIRTILCVLFCVFFTFFALSFFFIQLVFSAS